MTERKGPGRRKVDYDRVVTWRDYLHLRALLYVTLVTTIVFALAGAYATKSLVDSQKDARHLTIGVTCAAISAISEAGRATIEGPQKFPARFEMFLEAHGLPAAGEREAQAQIAANEYVQNINTKIQQAVGRKGDGIVRPDGTLDCRRLQAVAKTR